MQFAVQLEYSVSLLLQILFVSVTLQHRLSAEFKNNQEYYFQTFISVNGSDNPSCVFGTSLNPCQTLQYAYEITIHGICEKNCTATQKCSVALTLLDKRFPLLNAFLVNESTNCVENLTIEGTVNASRLVNGVVIDIIGKDISPAIAVGHFNSNINSNQIGYDVIFKNIHVQSKNNCSLSALAVWKTGKSVHFLYCSFIGLECNAVFIFNNDAVFHQCLFIGNRLRQISASVFGDDPVLSGALGVVYQEDTWAKRNHNLEIVECQFINNTAIFSSQDYDPEVEGGVGGGLMVLVLGGGCCGNVTIADSLFNGNNAIEGGGLAIVLTGETFEEQIMIRNCSFVRNVAVERGGAAYIGTYEYSTHNDITIDQCHFSFNSAIIGGAGLVVLGSKDPFDFNKPGPQKISFKRTLFTQNIAEIAAAIRLTCLSRTKNSLPVYFHNVTVSYHVSGRIKTRGPSAMTGSLFTTRVDIDFSGGCYFIGNSVESALFSSSANVNIHDRIEFTNNIGSSSGGAVSLADVSYMVLHAGANLSFTGNFAKFSGGAMYVSTSGVPGDVYPMNPLCFLLYEEEIPPEKWNVTMSFVENGAVVKGGAVFANTLIACAWSSTWPYQDVKQFLHWSDRFHFKRNYLIPSGSAHRHLDNKSTAIATATTQFSIVGPTEIQLSPGQVYAFTINATDELGNAVYSVATAVAMLSSNCTLCSSIKLDKVFFLLPPLSQELQRFSFSMDESAFFSLDGHGFTFEVQFIDFQSSFLSNAVLTVNVTRCLPGFKYSKSIQGCECDYSIEAIKKCEGDSLVLKSGYWFNVTDGQLLSYYCPVGYCKSSSGSYQPTVFNSSNPDQQCVTGRGGILCGRCRTGYYIKFPYSHCQPTCNERWLLVMFVITLAMTFFIFFFLVLYFNPVFLEPLRGVLFFIQILPYVFRPSDHIGITTRNVLLWLDLGGPHGVPLLGCWSADFSILYAFLLGYLGPLLICIILVVLYILNKFYIVHVRRKSPFEAVWILIVCFYKFMVETSLLTFFCVPFPDGYRFYYDGSIKCFHDFHLVLVFISTIVIMTCIIPPPVASLLNSFSIVRFDPHISDVLSKGLRPSRRWWWAYDLSRRVFVIATYVFVTDWDLKQVLLITVLFIIFAFHAICRPYKHPFANQGEAFLLFCLTVLALFQNLEKTVTRSVLTTSLVLIAVFYCMIIILWKLLICLFQRYISKRGRNGYMPIKDMG